MSQDDFNTLPDDINQLKQLVLASRAALDSKNKVVTEHSKSLDDKQAEILRLNEIIKLFQGRVFGKSSEESPDQAELFDEAEAEAELVDASEIRSKTIVERI